jgi:hypothetical protein
VLSCDLREVFCKPVISLNLILGVWCGLEGYKKLGSEKTRVLEGKETYKEEERRNENEDWEREE